MIPITFEIEIHATCNFFFKCAFRFCKVLMQTLSLNFNRQIVQIFRLNSIITLNFELGSNLGIEL